MIQAYGYAAKHSFSRMRPMRFERPEAGPGEVEVLFCGVCHTDIHQVRNDWGNTLYPCMPGHEMTGRVSDTPVARNRPIRDAGDRRPHAPNRAVCAVLITSACPPSHVFPLVRFGYNWTGPAASVG